MKIFFFQNNFQCVKTFFQWWCSLSWCKKSQWCSQMGHWQLSCLWVKLHFSVCAEFFKNKLTRCVSTIMQKNDIHNVVLSKTPSSSCCALTKYFLPLIHCGDRNDLCCSVAADGYSNWAGGQPAGQQPCVELTATGEWTEIPCNGNKKFVCKLGTKKVRRENWSRK